MHPAVDRRFPLVATALLALLAAIQVTTARLETQTYDEGIHLVAGVSYWRTGDYRLNPEHPALAKLLCALPVLFTGARFPVDDPLWKGAQATSLARKFLYQNTLPADTILFTGRSVSIAVSVLLGAGIAWWTRLRFGEAAALVALLLYVFDPNINAHGRYVTTDIWAAAFSFLTCVVWHEALIRGTARWYAGAGLMLGCALGSKFSTFFVVLALAGLAIHKRPRWRFTALTGCVAVCLLLLLYAPEVWSTARSAVSGEPIAEPALAVPLAERTHNTTWFSRRLHHVAQALRLPSYSFLAGLDDFVQHNHEGHITYLLGRVSATGSWTYFPVAFAVKTPTAVLILCAAVPIVIAFRHRAEIRRIRIPLKVLTMLLPFLLYWAFTLASNIDLGIRHLLPVYPFLYVMLAAAMTRYFRRAVCIAALALLAAESLSIYPHYLAFFNWPSGGPGYGPHYLVDSNIDWGQDLKKLKAYLNEHGIGQVCTVYFGQAELPYYGLWGPYLPRTEEYDKRAAMDCVVAASVTPLYGAYVRPDDFLYLRRLKPVAKIGYSIYVYDLRKRAGRAAP